MTEKQVSVCAAIKRFGFAQNNQVKLYGEVFDLVSDPISIGDNVVVVDAVDHKSGQPRRVRIPTNIVNMAQHSERAA